MIDDRAGLLNERAGQTHLRQIAGTDRVKMVHPFSVAIILGLAIACWLLIALPAYLFAA